MPQEQVGLPSHAASHLLPPQEEGGALYPEMEEDMYESLQLQYEELYMFLKENSRKSKVRTCVFVWLC